MGSIAAGLLFSALTFAAWRKTQAIEFAAAWLAMSIAIFPNEMPWLLERFIFLIIAAALAKVIFYRPFVTTYSEG